MGSGVMACGMETDAASLLMATDMMVAGRMTEEQAKAPASLQIRIVTQVMLMHS